MPKQTRSHRTHSPVARGELPLAGSLTENTTAPDSEPCIHSQERDLLSSILRSASWFPWTGMVVLAATIPWQCFFECKESIQQILLLFLLTPPPLLDTRFWCEFVVPRETTIQHTDGFVLKLLRRGSGQLKLNSITSIFLKLHIFITLVTNSERRRNGMTDATDDIDVTSWRLSLYGTTLSL